MHQIQDYKNGTASRTNLIPIIPLHHKSKSVSGETSARTLPHINQDHVLTIARPNSAMSTVSNPAPSKKRTLTDLLTTDRPRATSVGSNASTCSSCSSSSCSSCSTCSSASNSVNSSRVASVSHTELTVPRLSAKNKPTLKRRCVPPPLNLTPTTSKHTKSRHSPLRKTNITANGKSAVPQSAVHANFVATPQMNQPQSAPAHVTSFRKASKMRKPRVVYLGRQNNAGREPDQVQTPVAYQQQSLPPHYMPQATTPFSPYGMPQFFPPAVMGMPPMYSPQMWAGPYGRRRSSAQYGNAPISGAQYASTPMTMTMPPQYTGNTVSSIPPYGTASLPARQETTATSTRQSPVHSAFGSKAVKPAQAPPSNIIPTTDKSTQEPELRGARETNAASAANDASETTAVCDNAPEAFMVGELRLMRNVFSFEFPTQGIPAADSNKTCADPLTSEEAMKKVFLNICGRIWDESRVMG